MTWSSVDSWCWLSPRVTLAAGDQRRGTLVFEVPKNAKIERFQFALESGFAEQKGEWRLAR
ncbi:hypothetical protein [Nonomuraea sp. SBT364]|uniref:hypothetical protein n=1 Tax=Nonomuraea sp. SBT364 TaxID=1580530 RepID=UPI0012E286F7|nr:hypothetical protein [Nonomuraea sp. SBT364]